MKDIIEPKLLKGFRDSLPEQELVKRELINRIENTFLQFGFVPIDTPVMEYSEILLGKGGGETEKQVFRFMDHGERDVSLRYDLTVPFARFMSQHKAELYLPFKRYHIAKVWRGENPQKGRYREFFQCDFDIVGADSVSADFEIALLMVKSLQAVGIKRFQIYLSHRGVFNKLLEQMSYAEKAGEILRTVDKLDKIGPEKVKEQLMVIMKAADVNTVLDFITPAASFTETLDKMQNYTGKDNIHIIRLEKIKACIDEGGLQDYFMLNPSITRGLDYYTGLVFETFLTDLPHIGSICSGGRYNNLTTLYSKEPMPGVGASIGLDRLMAALEELKQLQYTVPTVQLLILLMDENLLGYYHKLANIFREARIPTEVYPLTKKLAQQFDFASQKKIPYALICGENEKAQGILTIKDLRTRESTGFNSPTAISEFLRKNTPGTTIS
jgi:histidyl-tRNA synthetase